MSLELSKLEKARELAGGILQARCPACAEAGHDRSGEHLRIYPDGRFGCCVHPRDGSHRKRIFALAGARQPGTFTLRIKTPPALPAAKSVKAALTIPKTPTLVDSRTPRTGNSQLRARARGEGTVPIDIGEDFQEKLKDSESAVRSVRLAGAVEPLARVGERLPFLTAGGALSIPFDSPERYHWWKGGQSAAETRRELERFQHSTFAVET